MKQYNTMKHQICKNCVMDTTDPNIKFDENGVCERCNDFNTKILPNWDFGKNKQKDLEAIVSKIKKAGKGKKYDCLLGLSGGFDSSYLLHFAVKDLGLRPLVFHVDAGWNTPFAVDNIKKITTKLGIDLKIETMNWDEMREMQLAFFKAGVPHLDTPQDLAFVSVLDNYAKKHNIKYVLNGGNISTEVIVNPSSWSYWGTDNIHNQDIIKKFCSISIKDFPFTNIFRRKILMPYIYGVKVVKLLNYTPYIKNEIEALLVEEYDYVPYGQKHFEDILTKFLEGYWLPERFGYDVRLPQLSSLVLTKQLTREQAVEILTKKPLTDQEAKALFAQVAQMLHISEEELQTYFTMPLKTYRDYKHRDRLYAIGATAMRWLGLDKLIRK